MRIAVMGAGSIGGYFGGMLSLGGNEVTLIARGPHLEAIRNNGLQIVTDYGEFTVQCEATDDPRQAGPVDLVLLTVKTYHNQEAVPAILQCGVTATFGYTLLGWSDVLRAGEQIDDALNLTQIPPGTLTGAARPTFPFDATSFWAQSGYCRPSNFRPRYLRP